MDLLIDVEPQTKLTKLALKDGIVTVHEYTAWLMGYNTGHQVALDAWSESLKPKETEYGK